MQATVKIDKAKVDVYLARRTSLWIQVGVADISASAAIRTPVQTGRLRAGRLTKVTHARTKTTGWVYYRVWYAGIVHGGRGPVYPIRAKALRFVIAGRVVFAKSVGPAKAQPWLRNALVAWARHKRLIVLHT